MKKVTDVPSFFSIKAIGDTKKLLKDIGVQRFIQNASKIYDIGIIEARFVLKSKTLTPEISFSSTDRPKLLGDTIVSKFGIGSTEKNRFEYVLKIFETMFSMIQGCQVIIKLNNIVTQSGADVYAGDIITRSGKLQTKYVDQHIPALPSA